jgi:peptidoglycan hydrolase-like protein with peptidoglycan-binding domain
MLKNASGIADYCKSIHRTIVSTAHRRDRSKGELVTNLSQSYASACGLLGRRSSALIGVLSLLGISCASDATELTGTGELPEGDDVAVSDEPATLSLGATGPEVAAANAYFRRYGYFEDATLRADYPNWTPILGQPPEDDSIFGAELERAVRVFQARAGLEATGVIDEQIRALITTPRCGVPDSRGGAVLPFESPLASGALEGLVEKWAPEVAPQLSIPWRTDHSVTYSVANATNKLKRDAAGTLFWSQADIDTALASAFNLWRTKGTTALTDLTFTKSASGPVDVAITFVSFSSLTPPQSANSLADANGATIRFNTDQVWPSASGIQGNDVLSVATHEMGHDLGLGHSSVEKNPFGSADKPVMYPNVQPALLKSDDLQALAASPYTHYANVGTAQDMGSALAVGVENTWKVSTTTTTGGFTVHRWNQTTQTWGPAVSGGGGVRIDVNNSTPWIVTDQGMVRERSGITAQVPDGTGWTDRGNCGFKDIGAGGSVVWALGGSANGEGDYQAYRYNGGTTCASWLLINDHPGVRLDVATDGSPWVVSSLHGIYHRNGVTGNTPTGSSWSEYTGRANDIGIGSEQYGTYGTIWITEHPSTGSRIYLLNIQSSINADGGDLSGPSDALDRNGWFAQQSGGTGGAFITVGRDSMPWVVGIDQSAWRRGQ